MCTTSIGAARFSGAIGSTSSVVEMGLGYCFYSSPDSTSSMVYNPPIFRCITVSISGVLRCWAEKLFFNYECLVY